MTDLSINALMRIFGDVPAETNSFMKLANGHSNVSVKWPGVKLLVDSTSTEPEAAAEALASMPTAILALTRECTRLRALVPPAKKRHLFGTGCIRVRGSEVLLMNKAETGFGSFALGFEGWDHLLREWDITVGEFVHDKHGGYWSAVNRGEEIPL